MNRDKQLTLITEFFLERKNTMVAKGEDYATQDDVLSNFKFAGNICGISPEKQILSLIATKVARLGNLLDGDRKPNHESVDDTIKDLGCYTDLLYCIRRDIDKPTQKGILAKMMEQDEKDCLYDDVQCDCDPDNPPEWKPIPEPWEPRTDGLRPVNEYGGYGLDPYRDCIGKHKTSHPIMPHDCLAYSEGHYFRNVREDLVYAIHQITEDYYILKHQAITRTIEHNIFELAVADGQWKQL